MLDLIPFEAVRWQYARNRVLGMLRLVDVAAEFVRTSDREFVDRTLGFIESVLPLTGLDHVTIPEYEPIPAGCFTSPKRRRR